MKLIDIAQVVVGAGIGGGLRYAIGGWIADRAGVSFPWHTLVVNVSGAFLLGVFAALSLERELLPASMRLFVAAGLLGGFTTFSTLSYESIVLMQRGLLAQGAANMFGSAVAGVAAVVLGLVVGRAL